MNKTTKADKKRLNIVISEDLYLKMLKKVENSDVKDITSLIKISVNNVLKNDLKKDGVLKMSELDDILKILDVLYDVRKFDNPNVKLELRYLYNSIKEFLSDKSNLDTKEYKVNRLDITIKELVMLELSCKEIDVLIKNNIIKEDVYYVK